MVFKLPFNLYHSVSAYSLVSVTHIWLAAEAVGGTSVLLRRGLAVARPEIGVDHNSNWKESSMAVANACA